MEEGIIVGEFVKSSSEIVVGSIEPYKGKLYAHIRIFVPSIIEGEELVRTQKGISISIDKFPQIAEAVSKIGDIAGRNVTVARIPKWKKEEIRISLSEFRGNLYINMRNYYVDKEGDWKPTIKGVSIRVELLPQLEELVRQMSFRLSEIIR